jgi:hypothetical protein
MTTVRAIKNLQGKFSPPTVKQHPLFGEDHCYFGLGVAGFGEDFP